MFDKRYSNDEDSSSAILAIGVDLTSCQRFLQSAAAFLQNAAAYATVQAVGSLPQQMRDHPAPRTYITKPWSHIGIFQPVHPLNDQIVSARRRLQDAFEKTLDASKRVDALVQSGIVSGTQLDDLRVWQTTLHANLLRFVPAVERCYDGVDNENVAASVVACEQAVQAVLVAVTYPPRELLNAGPDYFIREHWRILGGAPTWGAPLTASSVPIEGGGFYQRFASGAAFLWKPWIGAHAVHSNILVKWGNVSHGPSGLGFPTTDQTPTADGIGQSNHFERGSIYWSPANGAFALVGAIGAKWANMGSERGTLGYPTSDEFAGAGLVRVQRFVRGSLYKSPADSNVFAVYNGNYARYKVMNEERGALGYPTSDEVNAPNGGRMNRFEKGAIYWRPTTDSRAIVGVNAKKYDAIGGPSSCLGYPKGDESSPIYRGSFSEPYTSQRFQNGYMWHYLWGNRVAISCN